ncbi:MAG: type II secretion system protein GspG [candidate division Zixibacteria bacterium]|nr:type II secretion system protein GspG [candidate division Zixibacteria bacterium]
MHQLTSENGRRGFTLVEVVVVIILLGIIAAVAVGRLTTSLETARVEQTKAEMEALARAIVGNPDVYSNGARTDFGYVGDIGALPFTLDNLLTDPGYATWNGPYLTAGPGGDAYKRDAWNADYVYVDTLLRSVGSGSNIDKVFTANTSSLLNNVVEGYMRDANSNLPGPTYRDSVLIQLVYPNGAGGMAIASVNPSSTGNFRFSNVPIGNQTLRVIYLPDRDTVIYATSVPPGSTIKINVVFPADLW